MPKRFYKHKLLLDEQLPPRQNFAHLNEHFDVKHIKHDFRLGGIDDQPIFELSCEQYRIILTINVKDFRPMIREDTPGVIGIPETWTVGQLDTKLTALLMKHGPAYFKGQYRTLAVE